MATSSNKSFESAEIDSRRTPSTTVDGCLAGRRPNTLPSLSQTKWRNRENLSNRFSSFLGVHQMILATFKSVNNASCRGMWEQQSKPSDLGWTGLSASRSRRCVPRSGFARSSPLPRTGLLVFEPGKFCPAFWFSICDIALLAMLRFLRCQIINEKDIGKIESY